MPSRWFAPALQRSACLCCLLITGSLAWFDVVAATPVVTVELYAPRATQTPTPVSFGQVFKPGDLPRAAGLSVLTAGGAELPVQVDVKARHGDGSLRHAVISLLAPPLAAGKAYGLRLRRGTAAGAGGTPQSLQAWCSAGQDYALRLDVDGHPYQASARQALCKKSPLLTWLAGPVAGEWHGAMPLRASAGQDHPHLSARFHVRSYGAGQPARVAVIVENTHTFAAGPRNYVYDVEIRAGSKVLFSRRNLTHYHHARWREVFWSSGEPAVQVRHDRDYLLDSGAVPHYDRRLRIDEAQLQHLAHEWGRADGGPMSIGVARAKMRGGGAVRDIGLLPRWSVFYVLSMDERAKRFSLGMGESSGAWPIHFRDDKTGRPLLLSDYPRLRLHRKSQPALPKCGGDCSIPHKPDQAHQPSLAYLPYLMSGDYYFLEELQFWTAWNSFMLNPDYREKERGLLISNQVRGQAWSLRTLGQAAYITPDDDPHKRHLVRQVEANLAWYNKRYTRNPKANALGLLANGYAFAYNKGRAAAPWQDDFFTSAIAYLWGMGFEDARPLLAWKARFAVGRMTAPGYCWVYGAAYALNVKEHEKAPVYGSFAEVYKNSAPPEILGLECGSTAMGLRLKRPAGDMGGYSDKGTGYPAKMGPALAAAVDVGVPGAVEAWRLFEQRSVKPDYGSIPEFAIVPRKGLKP